MTDIPFNRPFTTGAEADLMADAVARGHVSGDGHYTRRASALLSDITGVPDILLTTSCTHALEMAAFLLDLNPGDEIIMPSFTFVSTANAFALRGARPVFVDIRADTHNIDETLIERVITDRTKAIVVVHYAGVGCDMDAIMDIARRHDLIVIEDAAQGLLANYRGRPLGGIGHLAALSFHETKNIISGEGGALLINDPRFIDRAEIIWEKGTNRSQFFRGHVDKYTWVDIGSSYLPGEIIAAFLWAQMEEAEAITARRLAIWSRYHEAFAELEASGAIRRPIVPPECTHNGHLYSLLLPDLERRTAFIDRLKADGIQAVFHYVPLHDSPFGKAAGRVSGELANTEAAGQRLVRLPLWLGLEDQLTQPRTRASVLVRRLDALERLRQQGRLHAERLGLEQPGGLSSTTGPAESTRSCVRASSLEHLGPRGRCASNTPRGRRAWTSGVCLRPEPLRGARRHGVRGGEPARAHPRARRPSAPAGRVRSSR